MQPSPRCAEEVERLMETFAFVEVLMRDVRVSSSHESGSTDVRIVFPQWFHTFVAPELRGMIVRDFERIVPSLLRDMAEPTSVISAL